MTIFDPAQLFKEALITFPGEVLVEGGALLPKMLLSLAFTEYVSKPLYILPPTLAYMICSTVLLLYLAMKAFRKKTI